MYANVKIGDADVRLCTAASVNVIYQNIFRQDFIAMISSDETVATTAFMRMAFVMTKFAELGDRKAVNSLTENDFCDWLDLFANGDLIEALPEIQAAYMASGRSLVDVKKNSAGPSGP